MNELDQAYKAFKEYRDQADKIHEVRNFLDEMHTNSNVLESLECFTSVCKIDNDWVDEIEKQMPFVANAVMENRQFVRSDGEVLPIEKIRVVGKESIVDLSKHSNYITREPSEDGKIIPDKLMMPLKDNDYAVYENRFLYSLLIYLSQFIEIRLNQIMAITGKYEAKTHIIKKQVSTTRKLSYELSIDDIRFNDPYASQNNESAKAINTIKTCLNDCKMLLMTPLMKEVSKAAMVKPPIVKTNVFRFDHNFKNSLALYEFLTNYTKKGFTVEHVSNKLSPFQTKISDSFSEMTYLSSFLTYIYGNKLDAVLKKQYDENEKVRQEEENKRFLIELKRISKNIQEANVSPEEYIRMLEKGQKILEKKILDKDQEVLDAKESVNKRMKELSNEVNLRVSEEKEQLKDKFEKEKNDYVKNLESREERLSLELKSKDDICDSRIASIQKRTDESLKLKDEYVSKKNEENKELNTKLHEKDNEISKLNKEKQQYLEEIEILKARLTAFNYHESDIISDEHMGMEGFAKLELEKEAFDNYYNKVWKKNKKMIKKEIYASEVYRKEKGLKIKKEKNSKEEQKEVKAEMTEENK